MDKTQIFHNFVEEQDCNEMINRLEELLSTGDIMHRVDGRIGIINKDDIVFNKFVEKYKNKTIELLNDDFKYFSGYIATIYNEGIGMATHKDSSDEEEMGALMYLNDDYEGGELTYTAPDGTEHAIKAKKGDMVYCPSWYQHGVNKVTKGKRYFFTVSLMNHLP